MGKHSIAAVVVGTLWIAHALAVNLARYDFTGATGDHSSQIATFTAGPLSASPLTRGPGLTPNVGGNSINSKGWTTALDVEASDYYAANGGHPS